MNRFLALLLSVAACSIAAEAGAEQVDPKKVAAATALFNQAQAAMDRKDYAAACPKLEEVTRMLPAGVGGHLVLAQCHEGAGRLASAWREYQVAASVAAQAKRPEEKQARDRAQALEPTLARLTIVVPDAVRALPDLAIERDGSPVPAAEWGAGVPVDKGKHVVVARASGKPRWERSVDVAADGAAVSVTLAGLADTDKPAPESPPAAAATFWGPQRIGGVAAAGVGAVLVGVGSAFGAQAISKKNASNADKHCVVNQCDATGKDLRAQAFTAAGISTGTFVAGVVALAGGVVLFATAPRKPAAAEARLGVGPGSIEISGRW